MLLQRMLAWLAENRPAILEAVNCGAVCMGANTYIGNGTNFMVKAIADEVSYRTPSFFGYLIYSGLILAPTFGGHDRFVFQVTPVCSNGGTTSWNARARLHPSPRFATGVVNRGRSC